ncbi:MAG: UTRA domain-containing protein [Selenomonas sp.]|nr:UTRA domain-containing protein [Selenomonas sp.]
MYRQHPRPDWPAGQAYTPCSESAHRTIRAVRSTELEQAELCIPPEMPILEIEQVAFFSDGHPFEYSISHHRADKSEFSAISIR